MIEIGIKFSKPGYDATEELKRLSFDSNTISHSVYRQEATELSTGANTFKHGLTYPPKVWVNAINSYNTNNDARVPIEITPLLSEENIDLFFKHIEECIK
jgi:hypothetical protein